MKLSIRNCLGGILLSLVLVQCDSEKKDNLLIATAANMQFAMKALAKDFTDSTGIKTDLIISSSGKLTAQIIEGAPFDIFVAANLKYPQTVFEKGFALEPPKTYALGTLVLWTMQADIIPNMENLAASNISHIAIASPNTAPYGEAAVESLKNHYLFEKIKSKLVFGESLAQTNQFIISNSAEIGFTAKSVVLSPEVKGKGTWSEVPLESYHAIEQGVVLLKTKMRKKTQAAQFYEFLFSDNAKAILKDFGYLGLD